MSFCFRTALFGLPFTLVTCAAFAQPVMNSPMHGSKSGSMHGPMHGSKSGSMHGPMHDPKSGSMHGPMHDPKSGSMHGPMHGSKSGPMHVQPGPAAASTAADPGARQERFRSAFEGYRPFIDETVSPTSWREANDRVGRIGGWRAYAAEIQNEAAGTASPAPATGSAAPAGKAAGHEGHHTR